MFCWLRSTQTLLQTYCPAGAGERRLVTLQTYCPAGAGECRLATLQTYCAAGAGECRLAILQTYCPAGAGECRPRDSTNMLPRSGTRMSARDFTNMLPRRGRRNVREIKHESTRNGVEEEVYPSAAGFKTSRRMAYFVSVPSVPARTSGIGGGGPDPQPSVCGKGGDLRDQPRSDQQR